MRRSKPRKCSGGPLSDEAVNLREWRRNYDRANKIPEALAVELAKAASEGELAWQSMRRENDWKGFLPYLKRIISLKRQEATALSTEGQEIYNALIENFEPGENANNIQVLFDELRGATIKLLEKIEASPRKPDLSALRGESPVPAQESFISETAARLGYDLAAGRIDSSAHPFTSKIGPGDIRITTRFDPNSFVMALFSSIHETGHALYEQGLPVEHWGTPRGRSSIDGDPRIPIPHVGEYGGKVTGVLEAFLSCSAQAFPMAAKNRHRQIPFCPERSSSRSLIRTEADEVTYNLHIIMRFELEKMLIGGELEPEDLPEAWNSKMEQYLRLVPPDYADGVMQDVHWSGGAIGYFPSYALGNMYAAQFYAKAQQKLGDLQEMFEAGEFGHLLGWLRENIHSQGSRHLPRDLVKAVTGEELSAHHLIGYLEQKYERLYEL